LTFGFFGGILLPLTDQIRKLKVKNQKAKLQIKIQNDLLLTD